MVTLGKIFTQLEEENIKIYPYPIGEPKALTLEMQGKYAVFVDERGFSTIHDLNGALVHELGHCVTGATHHVCSPFNLVAKNEERANRWAFENYVPFEQLNEAVLAGLRTPWQLADWFQLPQPFIEGAVHYYNEVLQLKFGVEK